MNIITYGGGTNSTAEIIGLWERGVPIDLILFSDTGGEKPETYEYIKIFGEWLKNKGLPEITVVRYTNNSGATQTLEEDLLRTKFLPPPCYGGKSCSQKYKIGVMDKFCNHYQPCLDVWARGEKCNKFVGYDAGEERRANNAFKYDIIDKKYKKIYPLIEWGWYREDCINAIKGQGLPLPGKSACFFCPNSKKREIKELYKQHPDLFERAIEIERNGMQYSLLTSIKGLGRSYSWANFIKYEAHDQISFCSIYDDDDSSMPCGCYDG